MSEYKHDFIDDNPYLVSADAPDTSVGEGGSGGDESNIFIITGTFGESIITLDKTFAEIEAAQEAGKVILYRDKTLYTGDFPGVSMHTGGWTIWITSASDDPLGPYLVDIDNTKFFSSTADGELVYHNLLV